MFKSQCVEAEAGRSTSVRGRRAARVPAAARRPGRTARSWLRGLDSETRFLESFTIIHFLFTHIHKHARVCVFVCVYGYVYEHTQTHSPQRFATYKVFPKFSMKYFGKTKSSEVFRYLPGPRWGATEQYLFQTIFICSAISSRNSEIR